MKTKVERDSLPFKFKMFKLVLVKKKKKKHSKGFFQIVQC